MNWLQHDFYAMGEEDDYYGYPPASFDALGLNRSYFEDYVLYECYLDGYYGYSF
jgi:hypothetical protein